jgi:hypothetical protein
LIERTVAWVVIVLVASKYGFPLLTELRAAVDEVPAEAVGATSIARISTAFLMVPLPCSAGDCTRRLLGYAMDALTVSDDGP